MAGANVAVTGEVGLEAVFGFSVGKETEIDLLIVSVGFWFDW